MVIYIQSLSSMLSLQIFEKLVEDKIDSIHAMGPHQSEFSPQCGCISVLAGAYSETF